MKRKKLVGVTGAILFFLGFPLVGLTYFWFDMHRKIQGEASAPVRDLAQMAMTTWDDEAIGRRLGPEADSAKIDARITEYRAQYGRLKSLGEPRAPRTWAHEYKDQVWQFGRFEFPAEFEKGPATVKFTGTRLYLEKQWQIHDFEILK